MDSSSLSPAPGRPVGRRFETTRWTRVLAAGDNRNPDSRQALATLCDTYWYPVYAWVRRQGHGRADAEDLTQGFFSRLVEKGSLRVATPERGRFRSFLLASVRNYLTNTWHRARAEKRGGGALPLSLDFAAAEERYRLEPADRGTPERAFLKRWALTLLETAMAQLKAEMEGKSQQQRFEVLGAYLVDGEGGLRYRDAATRLDISEGAVKVAVHRMRKRFGRLLRLQVADTVSSEQEVEGEIICLLEAVGS